MDCDEKNARMRVSLLIGMLDDVDGGETAFLVKGIRYLKAEDEFQAEILANRFIDDLMCYPSSLKEFLLSGKWGDVL